MRTILLSLAMLAATATTANADINVWWELDGGDGQAVDQGLGKTLLIETPMFAPNGQYFEFELSMWIATDGTGGTANGCTGYRSNLWRGPDTTLTMEGDPYVGLLNPMVWVGPSGYDAGSQNNGDALIMNYGRYRNAGATVIGGAFSPLKVITIGLRIHEEAWQYCDARQIWQSVGSSHFGWAPLVPETLNRVLFGPNAWVYGNTAVNAFAEASDTELPVIVIHSIPEPITAALLAIGLTMLLRRR